MKNSKKAQLHEYGEKVAKKILNQIGIDLTGVSNKIRVLTPYKDNEGFIVGELSRGDPIKCVKRNFFLTVPKSPEDKVGLYEIKDPDAFQPREFKNGPVRLYYLDTLRKLGEVKNQKIKDKLHGLSFSGYKK